MEDEMLVLTRQEGEKIIITVPGFDPIEVTYLRINGNNKRQARIGVTAPKSVTIHREEIQQRVESEKNGKIMSKPSRKQGRNNNLTDTAIIGF